MKISSSRKHTIGTVLSHVAVWVVLILVPLMVQMRYDEINIRHMSRTWLMLFGLGVAFYANFSFAIDKFLYKKKYFYFIIFNVILFIVLRYIDGLISWAIDVALNFTPQRAYRSAVTAWDVVRLYNNIIFYSLGVGASLGLRYVNRVAEIDADRKRLQHEKLETEVNLLKYQLQPHFFFNTLNNIYSLIGQAPNDAQKAVHSLSKMMRYILYDNTAHQIALKSELEFITNFVNLKKLSLCNNVRIEFNFPEETYDFTLPPLLLIPLVENAFKHGVIPGEPSSIKCNIEVTSEKLEFYVENTINDSQNNEDRSHSGIGLQNLKRLLDLQYHDTYTFIHGTDEKKNMYVAKLTLPNNTKE